MIKRSLSALLLAALPVQADPPVVESAKVSRNGNLWTFEVTLSHGDTGWDHYADAWRVVDLNGKELGLRNLAHPHVTEQPFTRSLSGVVVPEDIEEVGIQARDTLTGWSDQITTIKLR